MGDQNIWSEHVAEQPFKYRFRQDTGEGECLTTGDTIFVLTNCSASAYNGILSIAHPNHLRCMYLNRKENHIICESVGSTVEDYISRWRANYVNRHPVMQSKIPIPTYDQRERTDQYLEWYLHEDMRSIVRQMIGFVHDVHKLGFSLNDFSVADLRIKGNDVEVKTFSGIIKFCGIGFISKPTPATRREDFHRVIREFKKLVGEDWLRAPSFFDFVTLSEQLEYRNRGNDGGENLIHHLAIMPTEYVISFIRSCGEKFSGTKFSPLVNNMCSCFDWPSKFLKDDKLTAFTACYKYEERQDTYDRDNDAYYIKLSFLRFLRNFVVHAPRKGKDAFDDVQIELAVMKIYRKEIFDIYSVLNEEKALKYFGINI